jgi:hypothetical protein
MVILIVHISHVLQPLDVTYFKPFRASFRKEKDFTMAKNNSLEQNYTSNMGGEGLATILEK